MDQFGISAKLVCLTKTIMIGLISQRGIQNDLIFNTKQP